MSATARVSGTGRNRVHGAPFRTPGQGRADPELRVSFACPICSGDHPRAEHGVHTLDRRTLVRLRARVEHEIVDRLRNAQPTGDLLGLLASVEARLRRLGEGDEAPTVERRQRISAEKRSAFSTG